MPNCEAVLGIAKTFMFGMSASGYPMIRPQSGTRYSFLLNMESSPRVLAMIGCV